MAARRPLSKQDCARAILEALSSPEGASELEIYPAELALMDTGRQSHGKPPWVKIAVPESWVQNLRNGTEFMDHYFFIRLPLETNKPIDKNT